MGRVSVEPVPFGYMHPPHRRCVVRARLGPLQQRLQVASQIRVCSSVFVLSVHARRRVRSDTQVRLE